MEGWPNVNATGGTARGEGRGVQYSEPGWSGNQSLSPFSANVSWEPGAAGRTPPLEDPSVPFHVYYEQLLAHPDMRMRDELLRYMTPVLVVFGNFSNLLAFVLLRRRNLRKHSACIYMSAYALANVLVLNLILGIVWMCFILQVPYIGAITDWGCRLWTFVSNVIIYCGIWFVVALSADRFIYLCYSHKAKTYCTVFAAKSISIVVLIMLVVVSIHAMWTFELHAQGCFVSSDQDDLHSKIWPLWSATVYSYLPLTLLLLLNIMLSISLCLKRHTQRRSQTGSTGDDFTVTTLVISFAFFLLTVPATVINIVDIYFPSNSLSLNLIAQLELGKTITEILSSANQTLLGLILLLFSPAFRQELFGIAHTIHLKRRPKVYEMGNLTNAERPPAPPPITDTTPTPAPATNGRAAEPVTSSRNHIEYEACNSCDITSV
ncbi:hypothetical protein ACOMHN_017998 [Nucella lapillus]